MKLLIYANLVFALSGCVESVTIRGQYADYKITPHKPRVPYTVTIDDK